MLQILPLNLFSSVPSRFLAIVISIFGFLAAGSFFAVTYAANLLKGLDYA